MAQLPVWYVSEEERDKAIEITGRFWMHVGWYRDHPENGPEGPFDTKEEAENLESVSNENGG